MKCVSASNQECKARPTITNINSNEPLFYPYNIIVNKCSGSCNNINDAYSKLCVPDVAKDISIKVFNLMSRTNETRHVSWHETCACKCRLDANVCKNKQRWNNGKSRCESKELIDGGTCNGGFIWNRSICECECDKSWDVREYLDNANCKCRNYKFRLTDELVEERSKDINGNKMIYNTTLLNCEKIYKTCTLYIVLLIVMFIIILGIDTICLYFYWYTIKNCLIIKWDSYNIMLKYDRLFII